MTAIKTGSPSALLAALASGAGSVAGFIGDETNELAKKLKDISDKLTNAAEMSGLVEAGVLAAQGKDPLAVLSTALSVSGKVMDKLGKDKPVWLEDATKYVGFANEANQALKSNPPQYALFMGSALDMANVYFESDRLQSASLISRRVQVLDTAIKGGNPLSIAEALLGVSEAVELAGSSSGDESGTEEERKAAIEQKYADRMERLNKIGAAVSAIEQKDYLAFADSALAFTQLMSANRADANGNPTVVDKLKNVTGFALNGRKALKSDPPRYGDFLTSVFNIANEYKAAEFFEDAAKVSVKAQALQDAVNSGDTAAIMTALMGVAQVLEETQIISEVADGIKGFVGRVLGKKRAFEAGSEKHELWAIDLGDGKDPEMRVASGSGISPTRHVRDRQSRVNPSVQDAYFGPVVPNVKAAETRGEQKARALKEAEQNNSDVRAAEKALEAEQQSLEAAMVEPSNLPLITSQSWVVGSRIIPPCVCSSFL